MKLPFQCQTQSLLRIHGRILKSLSTYHKETVLAECKTKRHPFKNESSTMVVVLDRIENVKIFANYIYMT